jgi:hypothetical protein
MSALSLKADIRRRHRHVCFVPKADIGMRLINVRHSLNSGGACDMHLIYECGLIAVAAIVGLDWVTT